MNSLEPENVSIIIGDITKSNAKYIVQQNNCVGTKSHGLSKTLFDLYPYANIYEERRLHGKRGIPGTIIIRGDPLHNQRYVVNMLAQYYTGTARFDNDTTELRKQWFVKCLEELNLVVGQGERVAFPWNIGSGLAGGQWNDYQDMIFEFARKCRGNVEIIKL